MLLVFPYKNKGYNCVAGSDKMVKTSSTNGVLAVGLD